MAHKSTFLTKFRRRRENRTDYKKRLLMLSSKQTRFVARKHANSVSVQLIINGKSGDSVLAAASSTELSGFGWKAHKGNLPAAYLTGLLAGLRAKDKKIEQAVFDIGLASKVHGSALFAALKGGLDSGLKIAHDEKALPKIERIEGKHIEEYAKKLDATALQKQFGAMIKEGADPKTISSMFAITKQEIQKNYAVEKKEKK